MKSSFPKRYKSILIVFMKMTFFYLDPYILLIFNLSCENGLLAQSEHVKQWLLNETTILSIINAKFIVVFFQNATNPSFFLCWFMS